MGNNIRLLQILSRALTGLDPFLARFRLLGLWRILAFVLKKIETGDFTPSVYGPWLATNWSDATFKLAVTGRWGFKLYDELLKKKRQPYVFLDIGANFGLYSLVAASAPSCNDIVSIEPNPIVISQLRRNSAYNNADNIDIFECAISNGEFESELFVRNSHLGTGNFSRKGQDGRGIPVKVRDYRIFDEILENHPTQRFFVKVDVEGGEPEVMRQICRSKLAAQIDAIFIEISPRWVTPEMLHGMLAAIKGMGLKESWRSKGKVQYDVLFERS